MKKTLKRCAIIALSLGLPGLLLIGPDEFPTGLWFFLSTLPMSWLAIKGGLNILKVGKNSLGRVFRVFTAVARKAGVGETLFEGYINTALFEPQVFGRDISAINPRAVAEEFVRDQFGRELEDFESIKVIEKRHVDDQLFIMFSLVSNETKRTRSGAESNLIKEAVFMLKANFLSATGTLRIEDVVYINPANLIGEKSGDSARFRSFCGETVDFGFATSAPGSCPQARDLPSPEREKIAI